MDTPPPSNLQPPPPPMPPRQPLPQAPGSASKVVPGPSSSPSLSSSPRRKGKVGLVVKLAVVLVLLGGFLVWDVSRAGPVWHALKKSMGLVEAPHPAGRWYDFGYRHGRTHAGVCEAMGVPATATAVDLAYVLKALGAGNPPREAFEVCLRGYEDGVAGKARRYAPDGKGRDAFPEGLEGL